MEFSKLIFCNDTYMKIIPLYFALNWAQLELVDVVYKYIILSILDSRNL